MKRNCQIGVLLVLTVLLLTSCKYFPFLGKKEESSLPESVIEEIDPNWPVTIGDAEIWEEPYRAVSFSASLVEQVYDLGLEDRLVGVPEYLSYLPAKDLPTCGTAMLPNLELLEELEADLILTQSPLPEDMLAWCADHEIPVVELPVPATLAELWQNYSDLAMVLKGKEDGAAIGEAFTAKVDAWLEKFCKAAASEEPVSVLYIRHLSYNLATGDTLEGELFRKAGFTNIADEYTDWVYPKEQAETEEGREDFKKVDIFFFDERDLTIKDLERHSYYQGLPATLQDRYLLIDSSVWEYQGLRMFEQFEKMVRYALPDTDLPEFSLELETTEEVPDVQDTEGTEMDQTNSEQAGDVPDASEEDELTPPEGMES